MSEFVRTQKVVLVKSDAVCPKLVIQKKGNYASYDIYENMETVLPKVCQTFPLRLFERMVEKLYDEGYKILEQEFSDDDLQ